MKKASQIAEEIATVVEKIQTLEWQLTEAKNRHRLLQQELDHYIRYNQPKND